MSQAVILMGVSGCGKSTIGKILSARIGWEFIEGDDLHSQDNIEEMASGDSLEDEDRVPWLHAINKLLLERQAEGVSVIISCSALKGWYREILRRDVDNLIFVYLCGEYETILQRMQARGAHFMKADMLRSQFEDLEPPSESEAHVVSIENPIEKMADQIVQGIMSE